MRAVKKKGILILTLCFVLLMGCITVSASSKSITVSSEDELAAAIKGESKKIVFSTKESVTVNIAKTEQSAGKTLVINAPNAKIVNSAVFKSITIKTAASYTEKATGNTYKLKGTVKEFICAKKSAKIKIKAYAGAKADVFRKKAAEITVTGSAKADISIDRTDNPWDFQATEQFSIDYWKSLYGDDKVILSEEDIAAFNTTNKTNGSGLIDLTDGKEYTSEDVKTMIEDYSFPSKEYIHERKITEEEIEDIKENRNLDAGSFETGYALAVENASIRAFPTDIFLTNEKNLYDYMQETGLNYGEPMIVLWESKDGEWYFVQAYDYNGWIKKASVGLCDRDVFLNAAEAFSKADVWCPKSTGEVEFKLEDGTVKSVFLRMGTYLLHDEEKVLLVTRDEKGNAVLLAAEAPADIDGSILKFTRANLLEMSGNILGTPYSWGDSSEKGMDCSSSLQSLFRCFGVLLPRNSSQQIKVAAEVVSMTEKSAKEKYDIISELPLGTILYMPGHVMLYLGTYDGVPYVLQNTTDSARDDGGVIMYNSFVLTSINIGKSGNTLMDRVTYAVVFCR